MALPGWPGFEPSHRSCFPPKPGGWATQWSRASFVGESGVERGAIGQGPAEANCSRLPFVVSQPESQFDF